MKARFARNLRLADPKETTDVHFLWVRIYFGNYFFYFGNYFFSMVSIGGGDVSGGGGLSLQRR